MVWMRLKPQIQDPTRHPKWKPLFLGKDGELFAVSWCLTNEIDVSFPEMNMAQWKCDAKTWAPKMNGWSLQVHMFAGDFSTEPCLLEVKGVDCVEFWGISLDFLEVWKKNQATWSQSKLNLFCFYYHMMSISIWIPPRLVFLRTVLMLCLIAPSLRSSIEIEIDQCLWPGSVFRHTRCDNACHHHLTNGHMAWAWHSELYGDSAKPYTGRRWMSEWYELLDVRIILIAGETYIYLILFLIILSFDMYINCICVYFLCRRS